MKRIGIDARLTYYRVGGISTYIRRLIDALARLDEERTHAYTVFHSRKTNRDTAARLASGFSHWPLWTPAHHRFERLALSVELAPHRLDLLHSPDFIPPLRGARHHVITVHDLTFLHYPQYLTADSRRYYNDQIEAACRHADHILAVSDATRNDLKSMLGVPEHKITVQLHGVDERYQPLPQDQLESIRRRLELPERFILFVGTVEPRKNIAGLLDAYTILHQRLPDAPPLLLVGRPGWLIEDIAPMIEAAPGVLWRRDIDDDAMPAVYNLASLLVLPAFYEGFGLPALEAMACGTIPVVSDRSALPEIVGEAGLLVDPEQPESIAEALHCVLTARPEWLEKHRRAGIERASTFTWERSARTARRVYERVLA
jgi:glycosyltransferase involved in cell wall biosynthesis